MHTASRHIAVGAAFFMAFVAAEIVGPLAAFAADPPLECITSRGTWKVVASAPRLVECPLGGECTQIDYTVTRNVTPSFTARTFSNPNPDHVAVLAEHDMKVTIPAANFVQPPCKGDPTTELGERDCSSRSVRLLRNNASGGIYPLAVEGGRSPIASSIVVKKGGSIEQCLIASLGRDRLDPNAQVSSAQQFVFKGCTITIPTDPISGEGGEASLVGEGCAFVANGEPVGSGELLINGTSVGLLNYGEGAVSSGEASCTTRVISRKIYSFCTCADVNGDGVPDDPRPPCPNTVPN
jgi:hypothetical protein